MSEAIYLPPHILAEIIDRFGARAESSTEEYLRFPLRHCNATARSECDGGSSGAFDIEIVDLSIRGIGFQTSSPVTSGAVFTVELDVPGMPPQAWRCRVVNVHAFDGENYRVGAQFQAVANPWSGRDGPAAERARDVSASHSDSEDSRQRPG